MSGPSIHHMTNEEILRNDIGQIDETCNGLFLSSTTGAASRHRQQISTILHTAGDSELGF